MSLRSEHGQSVVEAAWLSALILVTVLSSLVFVYGMSARLWAKHWNYEAALCLAEYRPTSRCRRVLQGRLRLLIAPRWIEAIYLNRTARTVTSDVVFKFQWFDQTYRIRLNDRVWLKEIERE